MKKVFYSLFFIFPILLTAQNEGKGVDRLLLPTTPRCYHTQKNHKRLLSLDATMARRRAFLDMSARLNSAELTTDVTIPVVVHLLYKVGTSTANLPTETQIRQQLTIASQDFRQTTPIQRHEADMNRRSHNRHFDSPHFGNNMVSKRPYEICYNKR
jgi:hypothetical protein